MEITQLGLLMMMLCSGVRGSSSEILHRQKRNWIIDSFTIDEGYKGRYPAFLGRINVEKNFTFFKIHGQGVDEDPKGILKINEDNGEISVYGPVDHETYKVLKLTFQALDKAKRVVDTQLGIEIKILDSNDNAPRFTHATYTVTIKESTAQGERVTAFEASDHDSSPKNKVFDFRIASVTPTPQDLEFYIISHKGDTHGSISFRGCLDHEKAEKYVIVVEAVDRGEPAPLSGSCSIIVNIEDGNNHLPVITQQIGSRRVKEGVENVLVSRLQVTDQDTRGTAAWKAKYHILGDINKNFRIATDPRTNEGLLYVQKYLNYEVERMKNLTITVENEIAYHLCRVESRSTDANGLWHVVTTGGASASAGAGGTSVAGVAGSNQVLSASRYEMTVTVEDVNEAPVFDLFKTVKVVENVKAGKYLHTVTATDPDIISSNTFVFVKGEDPADWLTLDSKTGKIITSKVIDRESVFVNNSIYTVPIYAVDNGSPPMTGTTTLSIQITDENDNPPYLVVNRVDVCQAEGPSMAKVTADDLDQDPYAGPFMFQLHGDVEGKWRVEPSQGFSVNLVKEDTVPSGPYELLLEVSDLQGNSAVHNVSVTVCNCADVTRPNCRGRKPASSTLGGGAVGIGFLSVLLLAGLLLLALQLSCKREKIEMPDDGSGQNLMTSNTENPGTDCTVTFEPKTEVKATTIKTVYTKPPTTTAAVSQQDMTYSMSQSEALLRQQQIRNMQWTVTDSAHEESQAYSEWSRRKASVQRTFSNSTHRSVGASSSMRMKRHQMHFNPENWVAQSRRAIEIQINKMAQTLQVQGKELGDYEPHVYAEEEERDEIHNFQLDAISIPDVSLEPDLDLDYRFNTLASVCMPSASTAHSSAITQSGSYSTREHVGGSYSTREHVGGSYSNREHVGGSYSTREHVGGSYSTREHVSSSYSTTEYMM